MNKKRFIADDKKLQELILYICRSCEGDQPFSSVKLNKLLFLADFTSYLEHGKPITGHEYWKLEYGPAPKMFTKNRDELESKGRMTVLNRTYHNKPQKRPVALDEPDLSPFSGEEISIVERIIRAWWGRNASEISEHSHQFHGWAYAKLKESIPYQLCLISRLEPTNGQLKRARELESLAAKMLSA